MLLKLPHLPISRQFVKFVVVGICSNLLLYVLYLAITSLGLTPKIAMSVLYAAGVAQTFVVNKKWTFRHIGEAGSPFFRYICTYLFGYLVNMLGLIVLVDCWHLPHQVVQGGMILLVACLMFFLQKIWVFR